MACSVFVFAEVLVPGLPPLLPLNEAVHGGGYALALKVSHPRLLNGVLAMPRGNQGHEIRRQPRR